MGKGRLALFPQLLGDQAIIEENLPSIVRKGVQEIHGLIAESEKGGRRFLRHFLPLKRAYATPIALLNEHTRSSELDFLLEALKKGEYWGLVSDAGLPCLADPGAALVLAARRKGIPVEAHVGPSSFVLALLLSGFSAQRFSFAGYLPRQPEGRKKVLRSLENWAQKEKSTQIFMEAPYRNEATFADSLRVLQPETLLCVAWDLTLPTQEVQIASTASWRNRPAPPIAKKPAVFLISTEAKSM